MKNLLRYSDGIKIYPDNSLISCLFLNTILNLRNFQNLLHLSTVQIWSIKIPSGFFVSFSTYSTKQIKFVHLWCFYSIYMIWDKHVLNTFRERSLMTSLVFWLFLTYLVLLYNVPFGGLSWTPLPTIIRDVINERSLMIWCN